MKTSTVFWGVFLIVLGIGLVLQKFNIWFGDLAVFLDLWPLALVIWGVSLLKIHEYGKKILGAVSAILVALFVLASISCSWNCFFDYDNDDYNKELAHRKYQRTASIEYSDKFKFAKLNLDGGACSFKFEETHSELFSAYSHLPMRYFDLNSKSDSNFIVLDMSMKFGKFNWSKKNKNKVGIMLNPNPVWDFDFEFGAVNFDCDLSKFKVRNLSIDAGAADIDLNLGKLHNETHLNIETGASNVEITIPETSGCRVTAETGLSSKDFHGFVEKDGYYITDGFDKAQHKIFIGISGGVSNFEISRK